jgi:hypothetical protein
MRKKLMAAATAMVVFAVLALVPSNAVAKNDPVLTYPTGTNLATESKIRAVNVGDLKLTGSSGTTTCTAASLQGTLKTNSGSAIEADINSSSITGAGGDGRCTGPTEGWVSLSNLSWCFRSTPELATDEFQIRGGACNKEITSTKISFGVPTAAFQCVYERSPAIAGTFSTHPEDSVLTTNKVEFKKISGGITCPTSWYLDGSFTLEKDEESANPFYISGGPLLTYPTGTKLATGSKIRARSLGALKFTNASESTLWECGSAEMTGTLKTNSGSAIEADIEDASFSGTGTEGTCTYPLAGNTEWTFNSATNGLPWCLRATSGMAADELQIRGNSCANEARPIRVSFEITAVTSCRYERKAAITGSYTTHPEDAVLHFNNAIFLEIEPKEACVDETTLDTSLTLERDEAGTKPMYIS